MTTMTTVLQVSIDEGRTWGTLRSQPGAATTLTREGRDVISYLEGQRQGWQSYSRFASAVFRIGVLTGAGEFRRLERLETR